MIPAPGLYLGRAEVLRGLRNFLNVDRPEHCSTDSLKEGVGGGGVVGGGGGVEEEEKKKKEWG